MHQAIKIDNRYHFCVDKKTGESHSIFYIFKKQKERGRAMYALMKNCLKVFLAVSVFSGVVFSHDHDPESILGKNISLFERDHAFSGEILSRPVYGAFEHNPYGSHLVFRKNDKNIELVFQLDRENNLYSAKIIEKIKNTETGETEALETSIVFLGLERENNEATLSYEIDGQRIDVKLQAQKFENNHFKNSVFSGAIGLEKIQFVFSGYSCAGYSLNMAMMIFGVYAHLLQ